MRSLLAIFSLFFLVSFQAVEACCGHEHEEHVHVEKLADGATEQIVKHSNHQHHHHGPCGCECHKEHPPEKASFPAPRFEFEPLPMLAVSTSRTKAKQCQSTSNTPIIAQNLSLPPPSAAKLCSQHCRFLL